MKKKISMNDTSLVDMMEGDVSTILDVCPVSLEDAVQYWRDRAEAPSILYIPEILRGREPMSPSSRKDRQRHDRMIRDSRRQGVELSCRARDVPNPHAWTQEELTLNVMSRKDIWRWLRLVNASLLAERQRLDRLKASAMAAAPPPAPDGFKWVLASVTRNPREASVAPLFKMRDQLRDELENRKMLTDGINRLARSGGRNLRGLRRIQGVRYWRAYRLSPSLALDLLRYTLLGHTANALLSGAYQSDPDISTD